MDATGQQRADGGKLEPQASGSQAERGVKRSRASVVASPAPGCGPGVEPAPKVSRPETSARGAAAQLNEQPPGHAAAPNPGQSSWSQANGAGVHHGAGSSMQRALGLQYAPRRCPPLPRFDGNPLHWANFHLSWLDTNRQFSPTEDENRQRLQEALCGEALAGVRHSLTAGQSPASIYETLYRRYHHMSHHFAILLQQVYQTVRPAPPNLLTMLCSFRDALVELIRHLHLQQVHLLMNNCELANYLAAMLPAECFRTWSLYFNNDDNLYGLLAFVQLKLTNLQRTALLLDSPSDTEPESDN